MKRFFLSVCSLSAVLIVLLFLVFPKDEPETFSNQVVFIPQGEGSHPVAIEPPSHTASVDFAVRDCKRVIYIPHWVWEDLGLSVPISDTASILEEALILNGGPYLDPPDTGRPSIVQQRERLRDIPFYDLWPHPHPYENNGIYIPYKIWNEFG